MPSSSCKVLVLAVATPLVLTGCPSGGGPPDADAVIDAVRFIEEDYRQEDAEFLVPPRVGVGTQALPSFSAPGGYDIVLRCLSDEMPRARISDPQAAAETGPGPSSDVDHDLDRPCAGGMWGAGRDSTGGPVDVTITAGAETYWVVAVFKDDAVRDAAGPG